MYTKVDINDSDWKNKLEKVLESHETYYMNGFCVVDGSGGDFGIEDRNYITKRQIYYSNKRLFESRVYYYNKKVNLFDNTNYIRTPEQKFGINWRSVLASVPTKLVDVFIQKNNLFIIQ